MGHVKGSPQGMEGAAGQRPVVLTVAGSDSAGMAGLQMDLRTQQALGVHGVAAVSANTVQPPDGATRVNAVAAALLGEQLEAAARLRPAVLKAGLLCNAGQVRALCDFMDTHPLPLIHDPVLASTAGDRLADGDLPRAVMEHLLPRTHLLTPNREEAARLTGLPADQPEQVEALARLLVEERGLHAVLVKGGHAEGPLAADYFHSRARRFWLSSPRVDTPHTRGTGCALASAIAAALALGYVLADAVVIGKMALNQGLRQGYGCANLPGPVHITGFPAAPADLPWLHAAAPHKEPPAFPDCGDTPLGLYPVVDRAHWLERLLPLGVSTIQLRVKDLEGPDLEREIARAVEVARRYDCRLFINDHWQLAIAQGAYGVHLGQEDAETAGLEAIRRAGLRLGISTHCHHEVAAAHSARPSYLACGPVYHTATKDMPWIPHGARGLAYWRSVLRDYPLVAIGGINGERMAEVLATGVDGIAMITAITRAADPQAVTREFLAPWGG